MTKMTNPHLVFVDYKQNEIVFKRHHSPCAGDMIGRIPFCGVGEGFAGIKKTVKITVGNSLTAGAFCDVLSNAIKIAKGAWRK